MTTTAMTPRMARTLPAEYRGKLMAIAREVTFPQGIRLFNEGGRADRFWIIQSGTVALDMRVPGRRAAVIETLGFGELVGWSWLFPPHVWQLGAATVSPVRAFEFDAEAVRTMCRADRAMGSAVAHWVGRVMAHRLRATRTRLLDLYAPYGSGMPG
ncbi:cyclic nucleotide-binding domain-containing protein [Streptomyces sp. NPDC046909]|uniref:Crp/Fnr family transcriptional regulator n=1 Tax=Streptomyces sp. NPDC046909 TaxID=3155617 RepID=UPI0033C89A4E